MSCNHRRRDGMKIRSGFVSNSSSSSFIVLFPHKPANKDDLKSMMFDKWNGSEIIDDDLDLKLGLTIDQIVERVFNDIKNGQKDCYNAESVHNALNGHIDGLDGEGTMVALLYKRWRDASDKFNKLYRYSQKYISIDGEMSLENEKEWKKDPNYPEYQNKLEAEKEAEKAWGEERNSAAKEMYDNFRKLYKYHSFEFIFEYGDRRGEHILEHCNIFRNLPHLTIDNH